MTTPGSVRRLAGKGTLHLVWANEIGGLTYKVVRGDEAVFVKWTPIEGSAHLTAEALRMTWAIGFTTVPLIVERGSDDVGAWIVTKALPGESAVSDRWLSDPTTAVQAIGEGLREFHDSLPIRDCPFSWSAHDRVTEIEERFSRTTPHRDKWDAAHRRLTPAEAVRRLYDVPETDQMVVCQGDACSPNTLIGDDGTCSGHVDLGSLGTGDRWSDLAVATWSTQWNYGPGWEDLLLSAYGVSPDPERTRYYRLLWDLGP